MIRWTEVCSFGTVKIIVMDIWVCKHAGLCFRFMNLFVPFVYVLLHPLGVL